MIIHEHHGKYPQFGAGTFVAPDATVIGEVTMGVDCSIWFGVKMRGDVNYIQIGDRTNIQDGTICHVTLNQWPLILGNDVTVGHGAILHGCIIHDEVLIGMGAKVLDGAEIGKGAIIAAGALVLEGMNVPEYTLVAGVPGKVKRDLKPDEIVGLTLAKRYVKYKKEYIEMGLQHPALKTVGG